VRLLWSGTLVAIAAAITLVGATVRCGSGHYVASEVHSGSSGGTHPKHDLVQQLCMRRCMHAYLPARHTHAQLYANDYSPVVHGERRTREVSPFAAVHQRSGSNADEQCNQRT